MTKSMARNEVETTYRLDVLERKMGDLQERMNRMETLLQGMINPQTRVNEKRPMQDLGQPGDLDREMARRVDDLKQIVATGWEQDQLPDESTPEGNSKLPSTGLSLVATGWGEDPKPHAVIASPTLNNPNPSHGPEMAKDMEKGVSAVAEKHALIEGVVLNTLDKQIRHFTGSGNTPMVYPLKPVIEEIQKSDLAQLYVVGRADKRLRCTGLFWKLPPWPDFCAMSGDSFAQHCGYEVIESFYSMKQNNHSVLDYTVKFEELIKIWSIMNEDYYARVEGWEITSNFSKAVGLATMIAVKRADLDNIDEYVRNTIARAFNVMASALGISAFLPFLKAVDFISPLMDALYASYYTKEVMQALIREFQSPDEEMKKIVLKVVIQSVNTESVEADYIRNDIPPEFLCHFWVGVADIIGRIVENLKDESEPYLPQNGSTIKWRLNNKSAKVRRQAADLISRIAIVTKQCQEEQLMGYLGVVLYEFWEKASSFEKSMKYKKLANAQIPNRRFTLGVVEYTEGVGMQTETVLRQALGEKIRPVLTVSKMDRCFLELQVKEKETVAFSASLHGWAFTLSSFAKMYASKFGVEESKMMERFWGENFFDPTTKKWTTKKTGSATCKRDFVQFYYEPMKQIIKTCMNDQKDKLWLILRKLGVTLKTDEKELMGMTLFMRKGLTLWSGLPFEDQPVELYTVPMFQAFQDEIKQLMHVPCKEVARSGSSITYMASGLIQGKRVDYTVVYNNADKDVWCICHSFPSRGTPCSPVLAVLEQENVFMLSSKYILNRWRKDFRILHAFICSSCVASKRGLSLYDDLYMSGHEYLGDITDSGARELELKEFLLSVLKEAKDKLLRPIQTRHSDQRVDVNMAVIGQAYADRRVDANMASNTTALFHGDGKVDMKMAFPHLMQGNTRVDMNMVSTARTRIHTFDLVNDYFVEIRVPENALGGYNDEMRVLLPAIVKQIADFEVKLNRFSALKEISVKDYQNFNFSQPYSQASYYLSLILEDKQWPLVEKLEAPSKLESDSFAKFVPHLLLKTYLECYVQGDTKPSEAKSIVQEIEEIIFNTPNSVFNPLSPSQYLTKRVITFENELNFYYQIEGLNQKNENSSVVQYIQVHQDDAVSNIKLQLFSLIASHPAFNQLRTVESPGHTTRDCYNHVNMQDHQILISILEDKYGFEGRVMSDPAIGEELKKGLKSEENVSLLFSESI